MFLLLLLCSLASAGEEVVTITKGAKAPFTGTLLSPKAAARLLASSESELAKCVAESAKDKALLEANLTLQIKNKEAELAACTLKSAEYEKIYLDQIKYLEKRAAQPDWQKPVLFAGGVLTGVAMIAVSTWVIKETSQ